MARSTELSTEDVLREEAAAIAAASEEEDAATRHIASVAHAKDRELYRALNKLGRSALCFSGGGIRSASFALGVMQALATHSRSVAKRPAVDAADSLLARFHYLSTVSGGGYIGSWLSALIAQNRNRGGFAHAWEVLTRRPDSPDKEPSELAWLRENSNYLTPKLGISSADTWAAVAIYVRNLLLNWLIILPVLAGFLLVLKILSGVIAWLATFPHDVCLPFLLAAILGVLGIGMSLRFGTRNRAIGGERTGQGAFLVQDLLPAFLSAFFVTAALASPCAYAELYDIPLFSLSRLSLVPMLGLAGVIIYAVSWVAAWPRRQLQLRQRMLDLSKWALSGLVYGALVGIGICLYLQVFIRGKVPVFELPVLLLLACGIPWLLVAQLVSEMIFIGLVSYEDGSDSDREWFGRAAGWFLAIAISWLAVFILVFIGSELVFNLAQNLKTWLGPVGGLSGLLTALLGKSRWSPARGAAKDAVGLSVNAILAIAAPTFAAVLVITMSALVDLSVLGRPFLQEEALRPQVAIGAIPHPPAYLGCLALGLIIAAAIAATASFNVNINRFSLHALYRNRLIRAFLGASNPDRDRDESPFTHFAQSDNLRMRELWPPRDAAGNWPRLEAAERRPFHVINMALNIASTRRLAWQERKAEPFTASPLHAGSSCKSYRPSEIYGDPKGISLGTAVAISGAAASPNMGYHSSAPLSFLLAFWNVRLGWWLGNPGPQGESTYKNEGPSWAIVPFIMEIFGQTTDDWQYVYLSDGGHFENLGLYEMVRRRCRFIVLSDAGEDRSYAFEDLGNAVRKIRIDLGVPIQFFGLEKLKMRPKDGSDIGFGHPYWAIGKIDYDKADGGGDPGIILYIKPGYHGVESIGVRSYAVGHADFPHESTGNQWFSESQLESYRALGFEITDCVLHQAAAAIGSGAAPTIENLLGALLEKAKKVA